MHCVDIDVGQENESEGTKCYAIMGTELANGEQLNNWIVDRKVFNEFVVRKIMKRILAAVNYLHKKSILHGNIQPTSVILDGSIDESAIIDGSFKVQVLLTDFSLATKRKKGKTGLEIDKSKDVYLNEIENIKSVCLPEGSLNYCAPEILNSQSYGYAADMWSVGVLLFVLLGGYHPFTMNSDFQTAYNIETHSYTFDNDLGWSAVSDNAIDMIKQLLEMDPNKRLTASEAMGHPWIKNSRLKSPKLSSKFTQK